MREAGRALTGCKRRVDRGQRGQASDRGGSSRVAVASCTAKKRQGRSVSEVSDIALLQEVCVGGGVDSGPKEKNWHNLACQVWFLVKKFRINQAPWRRVRSVKVWGSIDCGAQSPVWLMGWMGWYE